MGWVTGAFYTLNPLFQMLRPISPIAWIPVAILWFGVGNVSPIFLIFISSVFPMIVQTTVGVRTIDRRYLRAAANFGVSRWVLFRQVVIPAVLPEIIVGMRIGLGVAWLVVVAAEMIALHSGLGYLIMDSRNAGNRYDLVIASMIIIGVIGLLLDLAHAPAGADEDREVALCPLRRSPSTRSARASARRGCVVDGVELRCRRRRVRRDRRPVGLRQVDFAEHHRRVRARGRRPVKIDGKKRTGPSRNGIMISQHGSVFPWLTVQQNLMFGLSADEPPQRQGSWPTTTSRWSGSTASRRAYPHELSGGMLKRVELARALVVKPEILYMDEPFSALDALMSLRMQTELRRILDEERHTVILITHDVEEAIYLADRILVLSPRPTTIQTTFKVDLPHPRKLSDPKAQALREADPQGTRGLSRLSRRADLKAGSGGG